MTVVYWLYDETCNDPWNSGYVGVTSDPRMRFYRHKKSKRFPEDTQIKIIFEGSEQECLEQEKNYRPAPFMGWNIADGGGMPPNLKGRKHRPESITKMKAISRRKFTEADRIKAALVHSTRIQSLEERQKRRLSALGKNTWTKGRKNPFLLTLQPIQCERCGSNSSPGLYKRWHGENCRNFQGKPCKKCGNIWKNLSGKCMFCRKRQRETISVAG